MQSSYGENQILKEQKVVRLQFHNELLESSSSSSVFFSASDFFLSLFRLIRLFLCFQLPLNIWNNISEIIGGVSEVLIERRANERAVSLVANYSARLPRQSPTSSRLLLLRRASCHLSFATCNRRRRQSVTRVLYKVPSCVERACVLCLVTDAAESKAVEYKPKQDRYQGAVKLFVTSRERVGRRRSRNRMCRIVFKTAARVS